MDAASGIQVLISSHNCGEYLQDCLDSMEVALSGYKWQMIFCDDASTDNTSSIINSHSSGTSADNIHYHYYSGKAEIVGKAKNRACLLSLDHKDDYPAICFMDADDTMGEQRISGLMPELSDDQPFVFGDYKIMYHNDGGWNVPSGGSTGISGAVFNGLIPTSMREEHLTFGPWSTLMHSKLIPEDGVFFREDIANFDDTLTWWGLKYSGNVPITPVPGFVTHYYKMGRPNALSDNEDTNNNEILSGIFELKNAIHPIPGF